MEINCNFLIYLTMLVCNLYNLQAVEYVENDVVLKAPRRHEDIACDALNELHTIHENGIYSNGSWSIFSV